MTSAHLNTLKGPHWTLHVGDVLAGLAAVSTGSVHSAISSPPYWGLRDYGFAGQIGLEATPEEYVKSIVGVCREVKRTLRDDGTMFLNLGDSYATGGGAIGRSPGGGDQGERFLRQGMIDTQPNRMPLDGLKSGNLIGIPWRVALALQSDGWILRQCIVWAKPAPMPESVSGWRWVRCKTKTGGSRGTENYRVGSFPERPQQDHDGRNFPASHGVDCLGCDKCRDTDGFVLKRGSWRPTTSHEFIFQFVKSAAYFCDGDGSKEPCSDPARRGSGNKAKSWGNNETNERSRGTGLVERQSGIPLEPRETRNMRSVWRITSEGYNGAHFATYPTELVRRCLLAATSRGGCCSQCGSQFAPVVESRRSATRPGTNSKVNRASAEDESLYNGHSGAVVGNRDPQRHTTTTVVTGYRATCSCVADAGSVGTAAATEKTSDAGSISHVTRPVVLDFFAGSCTTGQVAINMGCDFIGIEGSAEYAKLGVQRLETPWQPKSDRTKAKTPRRKRSKRERLLFS